MGGVELGIMSQFVGCSLGSTESATTAAAPDGDTEEAENSDDDTNYSSDAECSRAMNFKGLVGTNSESPSSIAKGE